MPTKDYGSISGTSMATNLRSVKLGSLAIKVSEDGDPFLEALEDVEAANE